MQSFRSIAPTAALIAAFATSLIAAPRPANAEPPGEVYGAPPPAGYGAADRSYDAQRAQIEADEAYERAVERWAAQNCVLERDNRTAAGAVIGGVLGALTGGALGRGAGAVVGGAVGATAGAAIGASATSPGCPPGYVVRPGAPPFTFVEYGPQWVYVAPPDYRPWIWIGGHWVYRPYPYHRFWRVHYWR